MSSNQWHTDRWGHTALHMGFTAPDACIWATMNNLDLP